MRSSTPKVTSVRNLETGTPGTPPVGGGVTGAYPTVSGTAGTARLLWSTAESASTSSQREIDNARNRES